MNVIEIYQMVNKTREIPYCRFHDKVIDDMKTLDECMRRECDYLYSLYPEEIKVLVKK